MPLTKTPNSGSTPSNRPRVLAILQKNASGEFVALDALATEKDQELLMIPTPAGIVVVSGQVHGDESALSAIIERLIANWDQKNLA